MAYRNFSDEPFAEAASFQRESVASATPDLFTSEEWSVIDLARHDGIWSLQPESRLRRLIAFLFGVEPAKPLANERLESLRRLGVTVWRRGKFTKAALDQFFAAGFSRRHAEALLAKVKRRQRLDQWPQGLA